MVMSHHPWGWTSPNHSEVILKVLPRDGGHRWHGSMLTSRGSKFQDVALPYHHQQASKVFHLNRWILQDRKCFHCKAFTVLWICCDITDMFRWRSSRHVQLRFGASQHSFPEVVRVNCRISTWHSLDTWTPRNTSSMECWDEDMKLPSLDWCCYESEPLGSTLRILH